MNGMALCAGVGGLELGLKLADPSYTCLCYVEREAYAVAVLVSRMADKTLDEAPVWDDIGSFQGEQWSGLVDIISAGFPCQPWSDAGNRKGTEDERWIWDDIARIIREVEPRYVFLENVPGLLNGGGNSVFGDLAQMGFDAEWGVFSAAEMGAPHLRKRLFILADAHRGWRRSIDRRRDHTERNDTRGNKENSILEPVRCNGGERDVANPDSCGQQTDESHLHEGQQDSDRGRQGEGDIPYSDEVDPLRGRPQEGEISREEGPDPDGVGREGRPGWEQRWWAELEDRGWWEVEPPVGRVVDGAPDWVDRIRACGNGVVPAVAAKAYVELRGRLDGKL